jgi:hypothetical protein
MIDTYNEIADDKLKVGMRIGILNGKVIERGEIVSIDDKFVRVMHDNKSVSAYQLGYSKFVELA